MAPKINTTATKTLSNIPLTTIIRLAFTYFAVVFSTGFLFGTIRQLYVVPTYYLPSTLAKIVEAPLMFVAVLVWANWLVNHYDIPAKGTVRLGVGLLGLGVMACVEFMGSGYTWESGVL
jgi:hypothetical protein